MVKTTVEYQGEFHCRLTHGPSGSVIETDAPTDNKGRGEKFSPTDLVGAALGSCILTTMAMVAERDQINFKNVKCEVEKEMNASPRRIAQLKVQIWMPAGLNEQARKKLEHAAHACPVHKSLHPETQIPIEFIYPA